MEILQRYRDSFSISGAFTFFVLYFVMRTLFFAVLIPGIFRTPLNSFKYSLNVMMSFQSFFSLIHFFLLSSFNRCLSSLGIFLLSSMSLRISASLSTHSSFFFAAAYVVSCISLRFVLEHAQASAEL